MSRLSAIALTALLTCAACGGSPPDEMLETAQFEEVQHNAAHARELYAEIIRRFPESPAAATARTRLTALTETR